MELPKGTFLYYSVSSNFSLGMEGKGILNDFIMGVFELSQVEHVLFVENLEFND